MASLFEKILRSVNSGVSIEEALAKHGTNQEVMDELLAADTATAGDVWESDGTNGSWVTPPTASTTVEGRVELATTAEVQAGTDTSRVVTPSSLANSTNTTLIDVSTGETSYSVTGVPSWATKIEMVFSGCSLSGSSSFLVQLGDSGGIETSGYDGAYAAVNAGGQSYTTLSAGFIFPFGSTTNLAYGVMDIFFVDANEWAARMSGDSGSAGFAGGGNKTLSDTLTQLEITTVNGTDTFDAGNIIVRW